MNRLTKKLNSKSTAALAALFVVSLAGNAYAVDVSSVETVLAAIAVGLGLIFTALVATKGAMIAAPWILSMMGKK